MFRRELLLLADDGMDRHSPPHIANRRKYREGRKKDHCSTSWPICGLGKEGEP
ncbi:MAG: hypothetical protein R2788_05365 [Saprospiraceae bacterium]